MTLAALQFCGAASKDKSMLVTILNSMSGPTEVYTGGQQYDVPDRRALALISRGLATAVEVEVQPPQGNEDETH